MSGAYITVIHNGNVYINGNNLLGRPKEFNLPEIVTKTVEYTGLGMYGTIEVPVGIEKLEGSATWNSFYPDVFNRFYNPMKTVQLMVRADMRTVTDAGVAKQEAITTMVTAMFKKVPAGGYKPQEAAEFATDYAAYSIVQKLGGKEILAVDPVNNIYRVNGEDMLAQFRANLGQ